MGSRETRFLSHQCRHTHTHFLRYVVTIYQLKLPIQNRGEKKNIFYKFHSALGHSITSRIPSACFFFILAGKKTIVLSFGIFSIGYRAKRGVGNKKKNNTDGTYRLYGSSFIALHRHSLRTLKNNLKRKAKDGDKKERKKTQSLTSLLIFPFSF